MDFHTSIFIYLLKYVFLVICFKKLEFVLMFIAGMKAGVFDHVVNCRHEASSGEGIFWYCSLHEVQLELFYRDR